MSALLARGRRGPRGGAEGVAALPSTGRAGAFAASLIVFLALTLVAGAAFARPVPQSFADLAAKVTPAVVNITIEGGPRRGFTSGPRRRFGGRNPYPEGSPFREEFERRFGRDRPDFRGRPTPRRFVRGLGSGFIIDPAGYVVTNNHVVRRAAKISVKLHNGETYPARLIGRDRKTDLALLKIEAGKTLPFVKFGDSEAIRVGDWVLAVGNPFGLGGTVTAGIISARGRNIRSATIVDFLQIDASINRGNSGGPTFNSAGDVVGVNTAIFSPNGGSVGLGFAIPANTAKRVIEELRTKGKVSRGWLGVRIQAVTAALAEGFGLDKPRGALIAAVEPNSPAARAGLRAGDVLLAWGGKPVAKLADLPRLVANTKAGRAVDATVWRERAEKTVRVKVGALPDRRAAAPARVSPAGGVQPVDGAGFAVADLTGRNRARFRIAGSVEGALIATVDGAGPAARHGIRAGDVVTGVSRQPVRTAREVVERFAKARRSGLKIVTMQVMRRGVQRFVALRVAQA